MKTLIRFEFQKILKNKTILGSLVASLFLLAGIFFVGYHYSQYQFAARDNVAHGYSKDIEQSYRGEFTDNKIRWIIADDLKKFQERELSDDGSWKEKGEPWLFHPFYLFTEQISDVFVKDARHLYEKQMERVKKGKMLTIEDIEVRSIKDLGFKEFGKPLKIGNYAPWLDLYKVQGNVTILVSVIVILVCSLIFSDDKSKNMNQVLLTTKYGRNRLIKAKIGVAFLLTIVLFLVFQMVTYFVFSSMYDTSGWSSSIQTNLDLGLFSFPLEWNHLQVYFWFLCLQFTGLLFTAGVTLLMSSLLNSPLSVLSFSISLYLLPYFLAQIFREGLAQKLLYLFPINQQSVGKLLGLFASNREYFFQDFIINSLCVFSFLIGLALLLKIVSYFHAKNWKFA